MKMYLVGSGIHGDLLSPNDKDIAIICSLDEFRQIKTTFGINNTSVGGKINMLCTRHDTLNFIYLNKCTIKQYVMGMDFDIVRAYRDLSTGRAWHSKECLRALNTKTITYVGRSEFWKKFMHTTSTDLSGDYGLDRKDERIAKYIGKIPKGWKMIIKGPKFGEK